jgi:hypothetical protein
MGDSANADDSLVSRRPNQRLLILRFLIVATRNCVWMALKNWTKILIGRRPYFDERGLFLWQYVLHLTGLRPIRKITCVGQRMEGPGSQALTIMSAINFAHSSGLTYVHTPFTLIQHADRSKEEWAAAWETLFNFGAGEVACETRRRKVVNYCHNFPELELCLGWNHRSDELERSFRAMVPEFRRKYYVNKSPRTTEEVTVAVHVRRGWDVPTNPHLLTSTNSILRTITLLKAVLDAHSIPHRFSVYSEGNGADLAEICIPGVEFSKYRVGRYSDGGSDDFTDLSLPHVESFLDIDAICAIRELIEADVLILSKSSFSYCAAIISDGIKIFEQVQEQKPMDGWLQCSKDGSFDCEAFERQLSLLIQAKAVVATSAVVYDRQSSPPNP